MTRTTSVRYGCLGARRCAGIRRGQFVHGLAQIAQLFCVVAIENFLRLGQRHVRGEFRLLKEKAELFAVGIRPHFVAVRACQDRRERLNIRREADGKLSLLNGLGANIKTLTVADEKGLLYVASDIPAGERATLERGKGRISGEYLKNDGWRTIYKNNEWITGGKPTPKDLLGPRMYFAVVEGSPFHEQGLHGAAVRNTESIVLGVMAEVQ